MLVNAGRFIVLPFLITSLFGLSFYIYLYNPSLLDSFTLPVHVADTHDDSPSFNASLHVTNDSDGSPNFNASLHATEDSGNPPYINASLHVTEDSDDSPYFNASRHRKLYSLSTPDHKYFNIDFGNISAFNPNIIPHPTKPGTFVVFASELQTSSDKLDNREIFCVATFTSNQTLRCLDRPTPLPVRLVEGNCQGDLVYYNWKKGPRDARVFWGPDRPYIVYGSLATRSCLGLFVQDLGSLVPDFSDDAQEDLVFTNDTEMQRPPPFSTIQKNWFLFWDAEGQAHVHQDTYPNRTFTQLLPDGSVGPDLSIDAEETDMACLSEYFPKFREKRWENIHQATNSLTITLCKRSDPSCSANDENTFIMTIFQHKTYFSYHPEYYPYVMLFRRTAPFAVHAISKKSLWVNGKVPLTNTTQSILLNGRVEKQDEMFYVTSMNWKTPGQHYHGYLDDPLFLGFGIEDTRSGGIDALAADLLKDLGSCADVGT
ncbi:hypothetical protein H2202_006773 [Exophiala xenobiotica]|nr:hypothetical protein H2202_006773 [Exophiala xenobiotica]KAK5207417.1 hypothetical protein LTR41_006986 [Exophiala xenobiotica]KAK5228070.1 hypothetical protein LTR72_001953 [Exophiala xenobiotica]KAK5238858.1 hypothetical protein LTR47_000601 [Exophiala xenobiotica]KAK5255780.1 hypothetical protein LTS06_000236 [Exophiala xenobiotica]